MNDRQTEQAEPTFASPMKENVAGAQAKFDKSIVEWNRTLSRKGAQAKIKASLHDGSCNGELRLREGGNERKTQRAFTVYPTAVVRLWPLVVAPCSGYPPQYLCPRASSTIRVHSAFQGIHTRLSRARTRI